MANPLIADVKLKVTFDQNGMPQAVVQQGGGQAGPTASNQPVAPAAGFAGVPAPAGAAMGQNMGSLHRLAMGGGGMPWWLDPASAMGSAVRNMTDAAMNPMMSGAEQAQIAASQGARMAIGGFGRTGPGQAAGSIATMGGDSAAYWDAIANAIGTAVERAFDKVAKTGAAATQTVQGIAAKYAKAGVEISDQDIDAILNREIVKEEAGYDAKVRVADRSGNITAKAIGSIQGGVSDMIRGSLEERLKEAQGLSKKDREGLIDALDSAYKSGSPGSSLSIKTLNDSWKARSRATDGGA